MVLSFEGDRRGTVKKVASLVVTMVVTVSATFVIIAIDLLLGQIGR